MIVPQYWAEAQVKKRLKDRQITIKRFGWSDNSQDEAQAMARQRAEEGMARALSGQSIDRQELKRAYNGAEGVPIREEIVARHDDTVITRNSYGALCLNTPDVLFADIDFRKKPGSAVTRLCQLVLVIVAAYIGFKMDSLRVFFIAAIVAVLLAYVVADVVAKLWISVSGGLENMTLKSVQQFAAQHPQWHLRIYRTPAGLRVLAMHQTFDPNGPEAQEFFKAVNADPLYVRMCQNQHCFRARLTPKPWRIGLDEPMRYRKAVWPIAEDKLPQRQKWVADYERASVAYAACRFLTKIGSDKVDPKARAAQSLHDKYCRTDRNLEIA